MSRLLINLRDVPDDEILELRGMLEANGIPYFETEPNRWGISMGAIWLEDDDDLERARALLADYQAERQRRERNDYRERLARGEADTLWQRARRRPLAVLFYCAAAALILYLSTQPFLDLALP
ncbi:hypothetical protein KBTX_01851 [wastewater metagenome]|uniref:DUF2007 domain-containing protein n=2 Tax=unclassified sequences TaxID=12908 RepID=A0A5B8RCA3_9ZZZZ|nr:MULTISPECIES: DUF6164 family protein [Arhodomonas]MCS4504502.1 DUF2007 domain-containing protein [Arhodomonas aquaeolei]QEA05528.1 hypothetical protein KBTEX_01851 [uncultured organism]